MHTVTSHKNDKSKYLWYHHDQLNAIHTAVFVHPQASLPKFGCAISTISPSKHISTSRVKSVSYAVAAAVLQERDTLAANELYGIPVEYTVESVQLFVKVHGWATWSRDTTIHTISWIYLLHYASHISLIEEIMIFFWLLGQIRTCFVTSAWKWNVGALQLHVDTTWTFKIRDRDLNKLTHDLNSGSS